METKIRGWDRRVVLGLVWAVLMVWVAGPAVAEELETLFASPEVLESEELYETLLYEIEANTAKGGPERKTQDITLDGSEVVAFLKTVKTTPDYGVCLRWQGKKAGAEVAKGHGCWAWFDATPHTQVLLTAEQAKQADTLVLENFDVRGVPTDWAGVENPANLLGHQRATYALTPEPAAAVVDAGTPPAPDATDPPAAVVDEGFITRMLVERGLRSSAKGILKCAHPTGKYLSMVTNHFTTNPDGYQVDFTINYRCLVGKRACNMSLSAFFESDGSFKDLKVIDDTAKTDPTIGLRACKAMLEVLKR